MEEALGNAGEGNLCCLQLQHSVPLTRTKREGVGHMQLKVKSQHCHLVLTDIITELQHNSGVVLGHWINNCCAWAGDWGGCGEGGLVLDKIAEIHPNFFLK